MSMANTDKLAPFSQNESSVALLNLLLHKDGFSRKTMYLLESLNTLTQNGTPIFKRTPPETLRGLSEGGRKNVAASFIAQAGNCSDRTDQEKVGGEQSQGLFLQWDEVERNLQEWALKEGCWFPDADNNLAKIYGPDEKKMLQYGYGVFKGDSFVSFSLDKGRFDAATNYEMARRKHLREQNEASIKRTLNQGQKKSVKPHMTKVTCFLMPQRTRCALMVPLEADRTALPTYGRDSTSAGLRRQRGIQTN